MPKVTVTIEPSTCILAANCVGVEPKLFQIGLEPYVELIDANGILRGTEYTFEATDAEAEMIEEAVDSCPTRAITMKRREATPHTGVSDFTGEVSRINRFGRFGKLGEPK